MIWYWRERSNQKQSTKNEKEENVNAMKATIERKREDNKERSHPQLAWALAQTQLLLSL